jgi:hypothetical protein
MVFLVQKNKGVYEPLRCVSLQYLVSIRATNSGTYIYSFSDGYEIELQLTIREFFETLNSKRRVIDKGSYQFTAISV